jgi:hypothetical protein
MQGAITVFFADAMRVLVAEPHSPGSAIALLRRESGLASEKGRGSNAVRVTRKRRLTSRDLLVISPLSSLTSTLAAHEARNHCDHPVPSQECYVTCSVDAAPPHAWTKWKTHGDPSISRLAFASAGGGS